MIYIGIDIAKFKHFASVVSSDGKVIVKPFPFETVISYANFYLTKFFRKTIDN